MKRVLLNWYYHRYDLTNYLLDFTDEMELVFLFHHSSEEAPGYLKGRKNVSVVFWGDFNTPYQLLQKIRPDLVVFADLESFNQIALNIAARNKGLTTFVLQHGSRGAYEIDEALMIADKEKKIQFTGTSFWSFRFLMSALRPKNFGQLRQLLKFVYTRKSSPLTNALFRHQFELRRADYYLEFSEANTTYHRKRDGITDERFILTGNPMLDDYFEYLNRNSSDKGEYCLLIDCPFVEANFYQDHSITADRKNEYLAKLDQLSVMNGYQLKVKLHPLSYQSEGLYQSTTISYYRDADLKELVAGASCVYFVHFSSVAPVILAYKPSIYFHSVLQEHGNQFRKLDVPELPLFEFSETRKDLVDISRKLSIDQIKPLLYSTDGKASERVRNAILSHS